MQLSYLINPPLWLVFLRTKFMTGYYSKRSRPVRALSMALGLTALLLAPPQATAQEIEPEGLRWARVDFLRNRVQLLPREDRARRARISDILGVGDSLRTLSRSRAELRFNDESLARIGERATFRFTPNTRNFQLTNGTVLLLIPPARGRSTIQTPNAVTGIQGSALFVRYIPETDTTIVGALTDNPNGPMVLFNRDGTEQQALNANEIGVIEGDQITQIYRFDSQLFWQSSGLAEGFDYTEDSAGGDALDGVRQEIREAIAKQPPLPSEGEGVIENPASFSRPEPAEPSNEVETPEPATPSVAPASGESSGANDDTPDEPSTAATGNTTTTGSRAPSSSGISSGSVQTGQTGGQTGSSTSGNAQPVSNGGALTAPTTTTSTPTVSTPTVSTPTVSNPSVSTPTPSTPVVSTPTISSPLVSTPVTGGSDVVEDLNEVEEPIVELEFEGTPAQEYLAAPPTAVPEVVPGVGEANSLVPNPTAAENGGDRTDSENSEASGDLPTTGTNSQIDETSEETVGDDESLQPPIIPDDSGDLLTPEQITGQEPGAAPVTASQEDGLGNTPGRALTNPETMDETDTTDAIDLEEGSTAAPAEVPLVEPSESESPLSVIDEDPSGNSDAVVSPAEGPTEAAGETPAEVPVEVTVETAPETAAPILPEAAPILLEGTQTPDTAQPIVAPESVAVPAPVIAPQPIIAPEPVVPVAPVLDPSNSLVPVEPGELIQSEPAQIPETAVPDVPLEDEPSIPDASEIDAVEANPGNIDPIDVAPVDVDPIDVAPIEQPVDTLPTPELPTTETIEPVPADLPTADFSEPVLPETTLPEPVAAPEINNDIPDTDIPFDAPTVGGTPLEDTLDPVDSLVDIIQEETPSSELIDQGSSPANETPSVPNDSQQPSEGSATEGRELL